jgi:CheY-like chemotaxis protein
MSDRQTTVLFVEDDEDLRTVLAEGLERVGYRVIQAASTEQVLSRDLPAPIHAAILDMSLEDGPARNLLMFLRNDPNYTGLKIIAISGYDYALKAAQAWGADLFLKKPISLARLLGTFAQLGI